MKPVEDLEESEIKEEEIRSSNFVFSPFINEFLGNFIIQGQRIIIREQHKHFYQVISKNPL